jgi:hypothetical protein
MGCSPEGAAFFFLTNLEVSRGVGQGLRVARHIAITIQPVEDCILRRWCRLIRLVDEIYNAKMRKPASTSLGDNHTLYLLTKFSR